MYKTFFWLVCLLLVSTGAMATPRALIRDGSQIGGVKETVLPLAYKLKRAEAISGAQQLDFQAYPDKLACDDLALFTALTQPHGKASIVAVSPLVRHTGFGTAPRNVADFVAEEIPVHIKLVLAQPAAPPVVHHRILAPRQAL